MQELEKKHMEFAVTAFVAGLIVIGLWVYVATRTVSVAPTFPQEFKVQVAK